MATIKVNGKAVEYVYSEPTRTVKLASGIEFDVTGSIAQAAVQKAFDALPKAPTGPINVPSPNKPREISYADYAKLEGVEGVDFVVTGVETNQTANHRDIKNCSFDLSKVKVKDSYQALLIHGKSINARYKGLTLQNISGYQIQTVQADKVVYKPGVEGTFIDRLNIDGFSFDGGGRPFHSDGNVRSLNTHDGVIKSFQFINNTIKNNLGSKFMVYLGNGFDFDIYGNSFTNINKQNNEDNGMFYLKATGKLHDNKASNYQGYLARIWPHSIDGRKVVEIYNNIGVDGDKYGLIELQFSPDFIERQAQPADAKVYNNTALNLNKTTDWAGELLTLYNTLGKVEYYNNLGATLVGQEGGKPTRDYKVISGNKMVFGQYDDKKTTLIISGQNLYFDKISDAVNADLTSKFKGVGASL